MINPCTVENMNMLWFTSSSSSHPVALAVDFELRIQEIGVSHYIFSMELIWWVFWSNFTELMLSE